MASTKTGAKNKTGAATLVFENHPACTAISSIVGPFEEAGPLAGRFDQVIDDVLLGKKSWEEAEFQCLEDACNLAAKKAGRKLGEIDVIFSGDLLNQIIGSSFAMRKLDRPYLGVFSACASWCEALILSSALVDGGYADRVMAAACSHHDTVERQYRFPIEFGNQRPLTAQWTVTGAAAAVIEEAGADAGDAPVLTHATIGRVIDMGVKDPYNMGAAMAPAAADTIVRHFRDTGRSPEDYDMILTGDLARVGHPICRELVSREGYDLGERFQDCGILIFDNEKQDVHAGASGAACAAVTFAAYAYPKLRDGEWKRVLLVATGSLHSVTTYDQGETMPCIAHAVVWEGHD